MEETHREQIKYHVGRMFQSLEYFLLPILAFFAPVKGILITVGLFILADTISGIWKARRNGERITSRGLSAIVSKMLLYNGAVLLSFLLDEFIIGDILEGIFSIKDMVTKIVALLLVYIEAQSISENYEAVKGVNLWQEFKKLLSRTKEVKNEISEILDTGDKKPVQAEEEADTPSNAEATGEEP